MPETSENHGSQRRLAAVVYNPTKVEVDDLKRAVADEPGTQGWEETLWFETTADDPGHGQAREAVDAGASVVIAAGGDGTVRAVAEALDGTGVRLALLPSGTGNLLARNLSLTLDDLAHSIKTAFDGKDRPIDLARVEIRREDGSLDKHAYLVMAGFGLDAKMLANTDEELKKKVGWLAYAKAIALAIRDKNELRFQYQLDGGPTKAIRAHTIIVGNCGLLTGNILLLPDAAVDDGAFDIVLMRPESVLGWIQIVTKVVWENGVLRRTKGLGKLITSEVSALRYFSGTELIVKLRRPELLELDGDEFGRATAIKTQVVPAGITIRVPNEA